MQISLTKRSFLYEFILTFIFIFFSILCGVSVSLFLGYINYKVDSETERFFLLLMFALPIITLLSYWWVNSVSNYYQLKILNKPQQNLLYDTIIIYYFRTENSKNFYMIYRYVIATIIIVIFCIFAYSINLSNLLKFAQIALFFYSFLLISFYFIKFLFGVNVYLKSKIFIIKNEFDYIMKKKLFNFFYNEIIRFRNRLNVKNNKNIVLIEPNNLEDKNE